MARALAHGELVAAVYDMVMRNAELDSRRWRVVVAGYVGVPRPESVDVCEGVVLVRDVAKGEWHSIYDCAHVHNIEIRGDTLSAALYSGYCGIRRQGLSCYLEVDLATRAARLWDKPHGTHWSTRRERPER